MISLLSIAAILVIYLILYIEFRSFRIAALVMVNLPLADRRGDRRFFTGGIISIASLVGFVTLASPPERNPDGVTLPPSHRRRVDFMEAIRRGSLERLSPILMTALCAGLALIPLALGGDKPGNEIQSPMAIVILGGLVSSTALNMIVIPALFLKFSGRGNL